jgi:hypothetical protein
MAALRFRSHSTLVPLNTDASPLHNREGLFNDQPLNINYPNFENQFDPNPMIFEPVIGTAFDIETDLNLKFRDQQHDLHYGAHLQPNNDDVVPLAVATNPTSSNGLLVNFD